MRSELPRTKNGWRTFMKTGYQSIVMARPGAPKRYWMGYNPDDLTRFELLVVKPEKPHGGLEVKGLAA
jgi:hypothetical protein